jgi:dienelactone hydrolase
VVAEKLDPASVAAAFEFNSTYASSQATLSTNDVLILGFNAFGGVVRWLAMPEFEIVVGSQGAVAYLSVRSRSGTSTVSGHIIVEER